MSQMEVDSNMQKAFDADDQAVTKRVEIPFADEL